MKEFRKWTAGLCLMLMVFFTFSSVVLAADSKARLAPRNQEYLKYLEDKRANPNLDITLAPDSMDMVKLGNVTSVVPTITSEFPAKYDLRDVNGKNFVTDVHNQQNTGCCWAMGTYGSMESCILKATDGVERDDFSEQNLKNRMSVTYPDGWNRYYYEGANLIEATAFFARWGGDFASGPVREADDPFKDKYEDNAGKSESLPPVKHVQEAIYLPDRISLDDTAYIKILKSAIMKYGAVALSFKASKDFMSADGSYYDPTFDPEYGGSHVITVVGWDDFYDVSHFGNDLYPDQPPHPGTWICKNSRGTDYYDNGYFYMSYYNHYIKGMKLFPAPDSVNNYEINYQYDPYGWTDSLGDGISTTAWGANIFKGKSGQSLEAVSFYTQTPNDSYEISIYTGVSDGKPVSGKLQIAAQKGTIEWAGYHTIKLFRPVPLDDGKFSVVVRFTTPGCTSPVPVETRTDDTYAFAINGQSFYSDNGTAWVDTTSIEASINVCIKGFSKANSGVRVITPSTGQIVIGGGTTTINVTGGTTTGVGTSGTSTGTGGGTGVGTSGSSSGSSSSNGNSSGSGGGMTGFFSKTGPKVTTR